MECRGLGRYGFGGWKAGGPLNQWDVASGGKNLLQVMQVMFDGYI